MLKLRSENEILKSWTKDFPICTIVCTTYNHQDFISDSIIGFLSQVTSFPIEIIVHDDASSDNTQAIINNYASQYPLIIKPILQTENQKSKGRKPALEIVYPKSSGKYIAKCEGDDYWTDVNKLQKQVEILENHPEFSFCYHRSHVLRDEKIIGIVPKDKSGVKTLFHYLFRQTNQTLSMVFRRSALLDQMKESRNDFATGDFQLCMYLCVHGNGYLLDDVMAVYRLHSGGVYSQLDAIKKLRIGIKNRRATLKHLPLTFTQRTFCSLMIFLRKLKLFLLRIRLVKK